MKLAKEFPADLRIIGEHIHLTPISLTYANNIYAELTAKITKWLDLAAPPESVDDTLAFIKDSILQRQNGTDLVMVILLKDEFIGITGLHSMNTEKPRIGLWLKQGAHGKGYGKETIEIFVRWARASIEFTSILYSSHKENIASIKIIESLGGKLIGDNPTNSSQKDYLIYP